MAAQSHSSLEDHAESRPPECPTCRDSRFVKQEQVITGGKAVAFWTCAACLRSWPAPTPRVVKADVTLRT